MTPYWYVEEGDSGRLRVTLAPRDGARRSLPYNDQLGAHKCAQLIVQMRKTANEAAEGYLGDSTRKNSMHTENLVWLLGERWRKWREGVGAEVEVNPGTISVWLKETLSQVDEADLSSSS